MATKPITLKSLNNQLVLIADTNISTTLVTVQKLIKCKTPNSYAIIWAYVISLDLTTVV